MALPSSITLNVGSPAADVVFNTSSPQGNERIYYADSPNGDLAGRIKLRVSHETSKSGIARSLVQFRKPIANADGDYDTIVQVNMVATRPETAALTDVDEVLEMAEEVLAVTDVRASIGGLIV